MSRSVAVVFPHWMQQHGQLGEEHAFRTFEHVVRAVTALSPLVEVQDIGTIVLSARGPSRYFGGDNAVAQKLHQICIDTNKSWWWNVWRKYIVLWETKKSFSISIIDWS